MDGETNLVSHDQNEDMFIDFREREGVGGGGDVSSPPPPM